jgi:hypothetical protein
MARAEFDGELLVAASLRAPNTFVAGGQFSIAVDDATRLATDALRPHRAKLNRNGPVLSSPPVRVWLPEADALRPAYRVDHRSQEPGEAWRTHVDASDGTVVGILDRVDEYGTGKFPKSFDGNSISFAGFATGNATARVYSSQNKALLELDSKKTLKNFAILGLPSQGMTKGRIFSRIAQSVNRAGADPVESSLVYDYEPLSTDPTSSGIPQYDAFDCVNVVYHIERFYQHLLDQLGKTSLASNMAMPVLVNEAVNEVNAFFSPGPFPEDPDPNPKTTGFLRFHDLRSFTGDIEDDLSRDPVVVCHEYVHALLFYEGLRFTSLQNFPPRAINEAVPDFYSTTFNHDTTVARYTAQHMLGGVPLRVLQVDEHFPETTNEAFTVQPPPPGALPSAHKSGETYSTMLLDIGESLGDKRTEQLVFAALSAMPHTIADLGMTEAEVNADPVLQTGRFFFECTTPLLATAKNDKERGAVYGAGVGRGILQESGQFSVVVNLENADNRKMTFPSVIAREGLTTKILFHAKQNRVLKITLEVDFDSNIVPTMSLTASNGAMDAIVFNESAVTSNGGKTITQSNIDLKLPLAKNPTAGSPFYVFTLDPTSGMGYFKVTLDA